MSSNLILEIDAGNSTFKWRLLHGGKQLVSGRSLLKGFAQELAEIDREAVVVKNARIASIAGSDFDRRLKSVLLSSGFERVSFAKVNSHVSGVRCGYQDLTQLGVDRWMAILAASEEFSTPLVVVDAGSAITIDLVAADKEHVGGYILPGWSLLDDALLTGTAICDERIPEGYEANTISAGITTTDAIGMGRLLVCAASINSVMDDFVTGGELGARLICTGGDMSRVIPHLKFEAVYRPDLVLDGLQVALG